MSATVVLDDLYFGEGPRWHYGALFFSDFYDHAVKRFEPGAAAASVVVEVAAQPSGLGWLPDGRMLVVSMLDRRLLRHEHDGSLTEVADLSGIATFHTNDMIVDAVGRAYVGNFGFDLDTYMAEHGVEGVLGEPGPPTAVLARVDPDGSVHVVAEALKFPNGAVLTPDGRTLILAETLGLRLTAFDVQPDGSLTDRRVWAPTGMVPPDGICLDVEGAVWVSNPLGTEVVRIAHGGTVLDRIETSQPSFACMLGGPDRSTLYICTAATSAAEAARASRRGRLEAASVSVPGAGLP